MATQLSKEVSDYFIFDNRRFKPELLRDNKQLVEVMNECADFLNDNNFIEVYGALINHNLETLGTMLLLAAGINPFLHLETIPRYSFESAAYIIDMVIPGNIERIGAQAFAFSAVKKIYIPKSVRIIHDKAFANMIHPVEITYGGSADNWGDIDFLTTPFKDTTATVFCAASGEKLEYK